MHPASRKPNVDSTPGDGFLRPLLSLGLESVSDGSGEARLGRPCVTIAPWGNAGCRGYSWDLMYIWASVPVGRPVGQTLVPWRGARVPKKRRDTPGSPEPTWDHSNLTQRGFRERGADREFRQQVLWAEAPEGHQAQLGEALSHRRGGSPAVLSPGHEHPQPDARGSHLRGTGLPLDLPGSLLGPVLTTASVHTQAHLLTQRVPMGPTVCRAELWL